MLNPQGLPGGGGLGSDPLRETLGRPALGNSKSSSGRACVRKDPPAAASASKGQPWVMTPRTRDVYVVG